MEATDQLQSALDNATATQLEQTEQMQASVDQAIASFQPVIQMMLIIGVLATVAYLLIKMLDAMHKRRIEKAILRIDENLARLVAVQAPAPKEVTTEVDNQTEQN